MSKKERWKQNLRRLFFELQKKGEIKSQADFARVLGTTSQQMSRIMKPDSASYPNPKMLRNAADAYNLQPSYFEEEENEKLTSDALKDIINDVLYSPKKLIEMYEKEIKELKETIEELKNK